MALDSLPGLQDLDTEHFSVNTREVLNNFLQDTQEANINATQLDGGSLFTGVGANNEEQSILVGNGSTSISGVEFHDSLLDIQLAHINAVMTFESHMPQEDISGYLSELINSVVGALEPLGASLLQAAQQVADAAAGSVQIIQSLNAEGTGPTIINATTSSNVISVLNLNQGGSGGIVVSGLDSVIAVGNGTVVIGDDEDTAIAGDLRDQNITGGGGNDTIFGGAGNDTIAGGAGDDVFGFSGSNALGGLINTIIEDFSMGDRLHFAMQGINNVQQLRELISSVDTANGNFTAHFADGSTITLVGVSADQVTQDLIDFG